MSAAGAIGIALAANAQVTVVYENDAPREIYVQQMSLADMANGARQRDLPVDTIALNEGKAVIPAVAQPMMITVSDGVNGTIIYTAPGEQLTTTFKPGDPNAVITGSELMEGISEISPRMMSLTQRYNALSQQGASEEALEALQVEADTMLQTFVDQHPTSSAAVYAVLLMEGPDMIEAFDALTPEARKSILYPIAEIQYAQNKKAVEAENRMKAMVSGHVEAPDFTFKNLKGEDVSLSQFRGKWVVIDFWGSWCVWCIKGIPQLKEAYAKYQPELEVIGIACNDSEEAWRSAVAKYELPWVNLFNPVRGGGQLLEEYGVQGFPTKAIINPEGKIVDITVGEDPTFYTKLAGFLKK